VSVNTSPKITICWGEKLGLKKNCLKEKRRKHSAGVYLKCRKKRDLSRGKQKCRPWDAIAKKKGKCDLSKEKKKSI